MDIYLSFATGYVYKTNFILQVLFEWSWHMGVLEGLLLNDDLYGKVLNSVYKRIEYTIAETTIGIYNTHPNTCLHVFINIIDNMQSLLKVYYWLVS